MGLQVAVTWAMTRRRRLGQTIRSELRLLLFPTVAPRRHGRGTCDAIRERGFGAIVDVAAVVLETDGEFSVIPKGTPSLSALGPVPEQATDAQKTGDRAA